MGGDPVRKRLAAGLLYTWLLTGCAPVESEHTDGGPVQAPAFAGATGLARGPVPEPDEETLCELVFGVSTKQDAVALLGETDGTASSHASNLLYQYATGLTLSLVFVDDVFSEARVYNRDYPACWTEQEKRLAEDAEAAIADGGVDASI